MHDGNVRNRCRTTRTTDSADTRTCEKRPIRQSIPSLVGPDMLAADRTEAKNHIPATARVPDPLARSSRSRREQPTTTPAAVRALAP